MTTLAADKVRTYFFSGNPIRQEYPVVAADIIYRGAAIGENGAGFSRPLVAGDVFQGFAVAKADNSAGAAGDIRVTAESRGFATLPVVGSTVADNDRVAVYAADDDTFTLTKGTNSLIGYVDRWVSAGIAVVEYDAALARAALQA